MTTMPIEEEDRLASIAAYSQVFLPVNVLDYGGFSLTSDLVEQHIASAFDKFLQDETLDYLEGRVDHRGLAASIQRFLSSFRRKPIEEEATLKLEIQNSLAEDSPCGYLMYFEQSNCFLLIQQSPTKVDHLEVAVIEIHPSSPGRQKVIATTLKASLLIPSVTFVVPTSSFLDPWFLRKLLEAQHRSRPLPSSMPRSNKANAGAGEERETPLPNAIIELLLPSLKPHTVSFEQETIWKSVRTENYIIKHSLVWRRSPLWTGLKGAIQLMILKNFHRRLSPSSSCCSQQPVLDYKELMLRFKTWLLKCALDHTTTLGVYQDVGFWMECMSKLHKVSSRLHSLSEGASNKAIIDAAVTCQRFRNEVESCWKTYCHSEKSHHKESNDRIIAICSAASCFNESDLENELEGAFLEFNHLQKPTIKSDSVSRVSTTLLGFSSPSRFNITEFKKLMEDNQAGWISLGQALWTVEEAVRVHLWQHREELTHHEIPSIVELFRTYFRLGKERYVNDPISFSKLILTACAFLGTVDRIAERFDEVYASHPPHFDLVFLERLLLSCRQQYCLLSELEKHFERRRQKTRGTGIFSVCSNGLPNQWALKNLTKEGEWEDEEHEKKKLEKYNEFYRTKARLEDLKKRIDIEESKSWYTLHTSDIAALRRQFNAASRIQLLETFLPNDPVRRNVVLFDKYLPPWLEATRDAFGIVTHLSQPIPSKAQKTKASWWVGEDKANKRIVSLTSNTKPFSETHYRNVYVLTAKPEDIVVPAGRDCYANLTDRKVSLDLSTNDPTTWRVTEVCTIQLPKKFDSLQWMLNEEELCENQVLVNQNKCSASIPLNDYLQVGSLFSGGHLRTSSLARCINDQLLTLTKRYVYPVITQLIYQVGPRGNDVCRRWKYDWLNRKSVEFLCSLLSKVLDDIRGNWERSSTLLSVILLSSMVPHPNQPLSLLKECLKIGTDWLKTVQDRLTESLRVNLDADKVQKLRSRLVHIGASIVLSFSSLEIDEESLVSSYLPALICINDNTMRNKTQGRILQNSKPRFQMLMTQVACKASDLLMGIDKIIRQKKGEVLTRYIKQHWNKDCTIYGEWKQNNRNTNYWEASFSCILSTQPILFQIDVLEGVFLVNGSPTTRLPTEIETDPSFVRVFGDSIFEVQLLGYNTFITRQEHNGCKYSFSRYTSQNGKPTLHVTERRDAGEFVLLHPEQFSALPTHFSECFSHWAEVSTGSLQFRPVRFFDKSFYQPPKFIGSLQKRTILNTETREYLLNIHSKLFDDISQLFGRLENRSFIHVFLSLGGMTAPSIHLPRLGLLFHIDVDSFTLECHQYPGFRVSPDQSLDCLIGLQSFLVIENPSSFQSILVPNSSAVTTAPSTSTPTLVHHITQLKSTLEGGEPGSPPYFSFSVDSEFKRLKADALLSRLFLAYLHIATSFCLPEPFTQRTGWESGWYILSHYQSNVPFNSACNNLLAAIAKLAPKRRLHEEKNKDSRLERVKWPRFPRLGIYGDLLKTEISSLVQDRGRLCVLHPSLPRVPKTFGKFDFVLAQAAASRTATGEKIALWINPWSLDIANEINKLSWMVDNRQKLVLTPLSFEFRKFQDKKEVPGVKKFAFPTLLDSWFGPSLETPSPVDAWFSFYKVAHQVSQGKIAVEDFRLLILTAFWDWKNRKEDVPSHYFELLLKISATSYLQPPPKTSTVSFDTNLSQSTVHSLARTFLKRSLNIDNSTFDRKVCSIAEDICSQWNRWSCSPNRREPWISSFEYPDLEVEFFRQLEETAVKKLKQNLQNVDFLKDLERLAMKGSADLLTVSILLTSTNTSPPSKGEVASQNHEKKKRRKQENDDSISSITKDSLLEYLDSLFTACLSPPPEQSRRKQSTNLGEILALDSDESTELMQVVLKDLKKSDQAFKKGVQENWNLASNCEANLKQVKTTSGQESRELWTSLQQKLKISEGNWLGLMAEAARVGPNKDALTLFSEVSSNSYVFFSGTICWYVVYRNYYHKAKRCLELLSDGNRLHLIKELSNPLYVHSHLAWSLYELQEGLAIRELQIDFSNETMKEPTKENRCLQLQMGEGKTSVILPMICLALPALHKGLVVRVNVLPSLLEMSTDDLISRLGDLLGRKVYMVPFRRDVLIGEKDVKEIFKQLKECQTKRGIIISTPEHKLSFYLRWKLAVMNCDQRLASAMKEVLDWEREHIFDILDESDEQLRHKFQLLYPIGERIGLDGGSRRWQVIQEVLFMLKDIAFSLKKNPSLNGSIEVGEPLQQGGWNPFRILQSSEVAQQRVCKEIVEALMNYSLSFTSSLQYLTRLNTAQQQAVQAFILGNEEKHHDRELKCVFQNYGRYQDLLMLRGLLGYQVLPHILMKRYSVDYGVRSIDKSNKVSMVLSQSLRLAVPFRAKDIASEKSEFGHPDVALITTHLSYYMQGLDYDSFTKTLEVLFSKPPQLRNDIYEEWVRSTAITKYKSTDSIIFSDPEVLRYLYESLRYSMRVINFWLSEVVLPVEARQYKHKLFASASDLVGHERTFACRGFSGTNDTKHLLPVSVKQHDLDKLLYTNVEVFHLILGQQPNSCVHNIPAGATARTILQQMVGCSNGGRVLVDAGALMLGKTNMEVAKEWLEMTPNKTINAAVFFENNRLSVIDRTNRVTDLNMSPYRQNLSRVLVYLDDHHTRGTDIKFPIPSHAFVTVGPMMAKEKLTQACMRMRQLGKGHTVCFWIADEVVRRIGGNGSITVPRLLTEVVKNTASMLQDAMLQWVTQGLHSARNFTADKLFKSDGSIFNELSLLPESQTLQEMYERKRNPSHGDVIASRKKTAEDDYIIRQLTSLSASEKKKLRNNYSCWMRAVVERADLISDVELMSNLMDEEQERELEAEEEQEKQLQCPPARTPAEPTISEDWDRIIQLKGNIQFVPFYPISRVFKRTSLASLVHDRVWHPKLRVTTDFMQVVQMTKELEKTPLDDFFRPFDCLLVVWSPLNQRTTIRSRREIEWVIVISHYEADYILPFLSPDSLFEKQIDINLSLHRVSPRMSPNSSELLLKPLRTPVDLSLDDDQLLQAFTPFLPQLAVLSGSKYFRSPSYLQEQVYLFLKVIPPSVPGWKQLLDRGLISQEGMVIDSVQASKVDRRPADVPEGTWKLFEACRKKDKDKGTEEEEWSRSSLVFVRKNLQLQRIYSIVYSDLEKLLLDVQDTVPPSSL